MKVLQDKILVKRAPHKEEKSQAGLYLAPSKLKEDHPVGEVVTVGEGYISGEKIVPLSVKPGDKVIFDPSWIITVDGVQYDVITEKCILLVL